MNLKERIAYFRQTCSQQNPKSIMEALEIITELRSIDQRNQGNLSRALGLTQGCLHIKDMEDFDKSGLVKNLEEIQELLTKTLESDDRN